MAGNDKWLVTFQSFGEIRCMFVDDTDMWCWGDATIHDKFIVLVVPQGPVRALPHGISGTIRVIKFLPRLVGRVNQKERFVSRSIHDTHFEP